MKNYLVQTKYPDGTVGGAMMNELQVMDILRSRVLDDCKHCVYDVSEFGKVTDVTQEFMFGWLRFVRLNGNMAVEVASA